MIPDLTRYFAFGFVLFALIFSRTESSAQCPQVYDFYGALNPNPYWYNCNGNDYMLNLQSPDNWDAYTIDWGDGSPLTTGASWDSPDFIQHLYIATVDTFNIIITETTTGCQVNGVFVMEEATSASIQIPVGGLTQACAPQMMEFINSSTNVSETTIFTWDFGDGSPPLVFDYSNWNQVIQHVYEQGTVDCETEVSLTAENYCNIVQGGESEATFNPIRIWDIDDAAISASSTLLCYPDTTVTFLNTTERNCLFQGNIYQRYEYWNFGDYWGQGQDSIIDWTPWPPTFPHTLAFPGIGEYTITLLDSNFCGIDEVSITIQIVAPPQAGISATPDSVCIGQAITFIQEATGDANMYSWNLGQGMGWITTGPGNVTMQFGAAGNYTVQNAVGVAGASGSCSDTASVTVTVLPNPVVNIIVDDNDECDLLDVNYTQSSMNAVEWEWTFDIPPYNFSGASPPMITYNSPGVYSTTLNVVAQNGCESSDTETVQVYSSPIADLSVTNLCEGDTAQFYDDSNADPFDPVTSWSWDFGDGISSTEQAPQHLYNTTGNFDVTLAVSTEHCSDQVTMPVIVEAAPVPVIGHDTNSGCSPVYVQFTNNTLNAVDYVWNFGDGVSSTQPDPTHTFNNNTLSDTTYTVTMTAMNAFGCGKSDTLFVTVMPNAQASFTDNGIEPGCSPFEADFYNTSVGADSYLWDFGDGTTATTTNASHLFNNTTGFLQSFNVTLYAFTDDGCNDSIVHQISIFPLADFGFDLSPDSGCSPLTITMPYIAGVQQYNWDFGDGATSTSAIPTHQYWNNTTQPVYYDVTLIGLSPFGCADTSTSQVLVNPAPTAQFSADVYSGCSPLTVTFENLNMFSDYAIWEYGDGITSQNDSLFHSYTFINNTNAVQVFDVMIWAHTLDGCVHQFTAPIEVYPEVTASVSPAIPQCSPATIYFNNTTQNAAIYEWDFGNGLQSTEEDPSTYYQLSGNVPATYGITLIATSQYGCADTVQVSQLINPTPLADFDLDVQSGCVPAPVVITNNSALASEYTWNYGDGTFSSDTSNIHTHIFEQSSFVVQEYQILLIASTSEGCSASATASFTMFPNVIAAFSVDTAHCSPYNAMFVNQSQGANSYEWNFGDGELSPATNPTHLYEAGNIADEWYTAQLVAENIYGCTDTVSVPVHIYHTPIAVALIDTTAGCFPMEVVLQNASIGADTYQWVYGTGEVSDTSAEYHTHSYFNFGTQPVTYEITLYAYTDFGCSAWDELSVVVLPDLHAEFNVATEGCTPFAATFDNNSDGAFSYLWDFGDGDNSNEVNPEHTFFNWGTTDTTFTVILIVQNAYGCADTADVMVTVFPQPVAGFIASPVSQTWPDATITIDNNTIGGELAYEWDMDNGTEFFISEPGSYTYTTWGTYDISLIVTNGSCSDTTIQQVEILPPPPVANFIGPAEGCAPLTVQFTNQSEYFTSTLWQFGDGNVANSTDAVYTYWQPGTYSVTLTITGFDGSTEVMVQEQIIHVYPSAIAIFTVTPSEVNVPSQPVYCLNLSQNADIFEWDFGDETTSNEENPLHYYQEEGTYTVMLIANNEYNCPDTMIVEDAVHAIATGELEFPDAFTPNQQGSGGGFYDVMSFDNDVFFPIHKGVKEYQLQIFNKWGELLFESRDILRGWDGYYRNKPCKQDVYVWKAKATFVDGQVFVRSGDVTLLVR